MIRIESFYKWTLNFYLSFRSTPKFDGCDRTHMLVLGSALGNGSNMVVLNQMQFVINLCLMIPNPPHDGNRSNQV